MHFFSFSFVAEAQMGTQTSVPTTSILTTLSSRGQLLEANMVIGQGMRQIPCLKPYSLGTRGPLVTHVMGVVQHKAGYWRGRGKLWKSCHRRYAGENWQQLGGTCGTLVSLSPDSMEKRKRNDISGGLRMHGPVRCTISWASHVLLPALPARIECAKEGMLPHTRYVRHWVLIQESLEVYGHLRFPRFPDTGCRSWSLL